MSFVKELDWQSVSLVVSNEEPFFDNQYLQSLSLGGRLALIKNYDGLDRNNGYEEVLRNNLDYHKENASFSVTKHF